MKISVLFFSLLSGLSVALLAQLPTIPRQSIGRGFFRSILFFCLLLLVPFIPLKPYDSLVRHFESPDDLANKLNLLQNASWAHILFGISLVALFVLFFTRTEKPPRNAFFIVPFLLGLSGLVLDSFLFLPHHGQVWWEYLFVPLLFASSAALLGTSLFAMLLGHWYLVQFDLDKKLLRRVAYFYCVALVIRLALIGVGLLLYWKTQFLDAGSFRALISLGGHGIFFWMRIGIGLGLPLVLAYMIYETARLGANQACTGLLYIAVVFVFMGEMISRYMFFLRGIPL